VRYDLLKILIVDDNRHMRVLLAEILKSVGVRTIYEAADGAEGLQLMGGHPVDLVITDLSMQPLDGLDFLRLLRRSADSPNQAVPVIMITGHSTSAKVNEARDAGVNEFLAKPLSARAVLERLHRAIERPQSFVQRDGYVGPDRRRRANGEFPGAPKRNADRGRS
jgi:two-component system, chemotaxis family, chemotaxis protein CheY